MEIHHAIRTIFNRRCCRRLLHVQSVLVAVLLSGVQQKVLGYPDL